MNTRPSSIGAARSRDHSVPKALIAACVSDPMALARLNLAFGASLWVVAVADELAVAVGKLRIGLVVLEPVDRLGNPVAQALALLRERIGGVHIVVYFDPRRHDVSQVLELGRLGATGLILRDRDDTRSALRSLYKRSLINGLARQIPAAVPMLPDCLKKVAVHCGKCEGHTTSAESLASAFGVTPRTLTNWARRGGFPGIGVFVSRCRVLHAIGYAIERGGSVESLAFRLGYGSAEHLGGMVRRHAGVSLRAAVRMMDFESWCRRLLEPTTQKEREIFPFGL